MSEVEKELRPVSFAAHATRGIIRDRKTRRATMMAVVALALFLMVGGSTFLSSLLDPREHPARFILFWLACAWVTVCVLLLAVFDLLMVRRDAKALRENLRGQFVDKTTIDSPTPDDGE